MLQIAHVRPAVVDVADPVARFAHHLPYRVRCTDDLEAGLAWAPRGVALLQREIAPDPDGWRTSLRLDVDCPCDRQPHTKSGYCPRAATYWEDAAFPQPSFVVVNPLNGHAHYIYLLRGWVRVDGADAAQLAAVRYYAAIERAYTRGLRADPGYTSLVHHNPLNDRYTTLRGRAEPYSLRELASFVTLTSTPRRQEPEIRCDGRNIETFDRLRYWAYRMVGEWRCGSFAPWADFVTARAHVIAAEVREGHPGASHAFSDREVAAIAKSVAGWVWLRYDGANPTAAAARVATRRAYDRERATQARRTRGSVTRIVYLSEVQRRRTAARTLSDMGLAVDEIARRLGAGVRSIYRWIAELRSLPGPSRLSDFEPATRSEKKVTLEQNAVNGSDGAFAPSASSSHGTSAGSPLGCRGEYELAARSAEPAFTRNESLPTVEGIDLLAYARQRLSGSKPEPTQEELALSTMGAVSGDCEAAAPRSESNDISGAATYASPLSLIQRRISEIIEEARRREPPS